MHIVFMNMLLQTLNMHLKSAGDSASSPEVSPSLHNWVSLLGVAPPPTGSDCEPKEARA